MGEHDLRVYAHDAAFRAGIDGALFERQIDQESGFNPGAYNPQSGASGIAQIISHFHPGVDPWNAEASLDYAAKLIAAGVQIYGSYQRALIAYNWGPGNMIGYTQTDGTVVPPWDGRPTSLPAETRRYLDVILGPGWPEPGAAPMPAAIVYDPDSPTITQNDQWSCAPTATRWALTAFGRHPAESWMESTMIADGVASMEQGLSDASGSLLARWITRQYKEFGYSAWNNGSVSFDDVKSVAGKSPVLLGGRRWGGEGHWSGVRRYDQSRDVLVLANPGGTGPVYGQQTIDRQQFAQIGPCSLVVITHESQAPSPPPIIIPPFDLATVLAENVALRAQVANLTTDLVAARSALGVASHEYADGLQDLVRALRKLQPA